MSTLIAYDTLGRGIDMSGTTTGGGILINDSSLSVTYLGAIDSDTIAFSVTGAGDIKYFVVSGTVNISTGDTILSELIWGDINADPLISWTNANLYVNLLDDFSSAINYTLLNGEDYIYGNNYADYVKAGAGNDWVFGYAENDTLLGEAGNDTLNGGEGDDQLDGGAGSDALNGGNGSDRYLITELTGGNDTVTDTGGTDDALVWNSGASSNTYIDVSRGGVSTTNANLIVKVYQDGVLKQTNTVVNQFSNTASTATTISGTAPTSAIEGVYIADDDQYLKIVDGLTGTASDELIVGTAGANTLTGNAGIDFMFGGAGNDTLNGGEGDDQLDGGAGSDALNGGNGNDVLVGGAGNDTLTGGAGVDYFDFTSVLNGTTNVDTITDFIRADDFIRLDNAVMAGLGTRTGSLSETAFFSGAGRAAAEDTSDRIIYNTSTGDLYYDADGTGNSAAIIKIALIGTSSSHSNLDHTDFLII